jgi:hypothetical protein
MTARAVIAQFHWANDAKRMKNWSLMAANVQTKSPLADGMFGIHRHEIQVSGDTWHECESDPLTDMQQR